MGASAGIMMATSAGVQGVSAVGSAYSQSQAMRAKGEYQQNVANANASLDNMKAQDAISRGESNAHLQDVKTKEMIGAQRASLAAQGVDVNSGSAADVQASTSSIGALDAMTIRNNAWRESWGYKIQATNDTYAGKFAADSADTDASNTLLTGGMNALSDGMKAGYYAYGGRSSKTQTGFNPS